METVRAGHVRRFGDLEVRVLHPFRDFARIRPEEQYDATVVVKLTYGATSILLAGDLDVAQEAALLRHDRAALKVSHHGSKNGTTPAFLEAVHPEIAVISVGRENRYGHPSSEIIDRLRATGVAVRRTDEHGAVTLTSDGIAVRVDVEQD
ncbi:MAG: ComEC/Rec2 family competence protein [Patescibacteria group bacterium]